MRLQSGYLLHREGRSVNSGGGSPLLTPFRTAWIVLEQTSSSTARLKFYNSRDESENSAVENNVSSSVSDSSKNSSVSFQEKPPFRVLDFAADDAISITTRFNGTMFRLLRTRPAAQSFEGVLEHVIDEFEPLTTTTPSAISWVKAISNVIQSSNVLRKADYPSSSQVVQKVAAELMLPPAATSTPRARRTQLHRMGVNVSGGSTGSGDSGDSHVSQLDSQHKSNDFSGIAFDPAEVFNQLTNHHRRQPSAGSSGIGDTSANICSLLEIVQTQRAEILKLERLLSASTASSAGRSQNDSSGVMTNEASDTSQQQQQSSFNSNELLQFESELFRLQEMVLKYRNRLNEISDKQHASTHDKFKWRQAYVQSIIGAMKIVVSEQRSIEKLELGLAGIDLHAANIQSLLSEAELPSLQKLAHDGRYVDDFGFVHKFSSSDPHSADILNFAAGLLMDHFSAQTSYSTENETFWKIHIDMNKPLNETALESALLHRRYIPERMRPDIWRLLLQNEIQTVRSKHRNDYYSLLARSAGFFGDAEADSSFLDSALTLLIGGNGNNHQAPPSPLNETNTTFNDENNTIRRQILVDIRRTLPNNIHFGREGRGLTSLYRVLVSFARHKPQLGYCQGINFIAAVLLLLLDNEEEVFWCLVILTENDRFFGSRQFDSRLTGARADQKLIVRLMSKHLPELHRHIEKHGTDLSTCFIPWLMCGFYDCVPFRTLLRIWDYFFMAGYSVFYRVAVALMKVQEHSLMEITDPTLILKHIKLFPHLCHDFTHLLKVAFEDLQASEPWPTWDDLLNQRRKNIRNIEKQDIAASMALRRRRAPSRSSMVSVASNTSLATTMATTNGPTFVTIVEADKCPDVLSNSSRVFVWVDDPVSSSSLLYVISSEKSSSSSNSSVDSSYDVLSSTTMPGFPSNESPIIATANQLTRLNGQLVLTFTQYRQNRALISTVQSTCLACLDLDTGRILWSFVPSSANDDDLYAAILLDSKKDIIYAITQFGTVLVLPCSELPDNELSSNSKQLTTVAFRLLTASPITCAAVLSYCDDDQNQQSILLIGAGSFVYRIDQGDSRSSDSSSKTVDRAPRTVAKIHIPLARTSESDAKQLDDGNGGELSFVRQIVAGQHSVNCDKDVLFWWALCDGSPCLVLYAMHKTNPMHCHILTTLSGTSCSPNCILLLPRPNQRKSSNFGLTFNSSDQQNQSDSMHDFENLLVGWPNGSIFQWQISIGPLNDMLSNLSPDSSGHSSSQATSSECKNFPCDCGCIIQPSISMPPSVPKSFQVQLDLQKGAPYATDADEESNKNILSAVRKAFVSTFMPSLSKQTNKPTPVSRAGSSSMPSMVVPSRFAPNRQSRRMAASNRNNSFLFSTKITSSGATNSTQDQSSMVGDVTVISSTDHSCEQPLTPFSSTFSSSNGHVSGPDNICSPMAAASTACTPIQECKLSGCFRLVSISNVFRSDCPVNWMTVTQSHDLGKLVWAFQLEWMVCKENVASAQLVAVLAAGEEVLSRNSDSLKLNSTQSYTPRLTRHIADHFLSPQQRTESWRTIYVSMKAHQQNENK